MKELREKTKRQTSVKHKVKREAHGPIDNYNALIECGELNDDSYQRTIVDSLQQLHDRLDGYQPAAETAGFFQRVSW